MSDERGTGAGDEERPKGPDAAEEPEFGSSDWLLEQLTGGRHVDRPAEPDVETVVSPVVEPAAEPAPAPEASAEPVDAGAQPSAEVPFAEAEAGRFDDLLSTEEDAPAEEPAPTEYPVAFSWNLTPGEGADPLVEAEPEPEPAEPEPEPIAQEDAVAAPESEPVPPPAPAPAIPVIPEPAQPSASQSPLFEPFEAPQTDVPPAPDEPASDESAPDEPAEETPAAVRSWVIESPTPAQPAEPEPPRSIFDAPPAVPAAEASESHGLAALLGFGETEGDAPSGRSVIGDTTSIIPIDPSALTRRPSDEPAPPVLPPIDAAALMESPTEAPASATPEPPTPEPPTPDAPTPQSDAAGISARLRAERDRAAPVLPSEPAVPAAAAEVALGATPSPATSAIDAQSIAAASEPEPLDATPADAAPLESAGPSEDTDGEDGLAALFGDVAEPQPEPEPEPEPEPDTDSLAELEPAADLEGPQLTTTTPFWIRPRDTEEEPPADPFAQGAPPRFTPLATAAAPVVAPSGVPDPTTAAAPVPPSPSVAGGAAPATAADAPANTAAPGGPAGPAGPAGPGRPSIWASRNNRILLMALGAFAVVLVLVGLFALGTRIPSLFGAAKAAPQPTASATTPAATPKSTPTPTPVPTVTPKPAAAVGPGAHPWNTLGGGECIQPFTTVWAEDFTVVDCTAPHTAQLVYTNLLSADPAAPYPGADALAQQIPGLCTAGGVIDLAAAGAYPDLQVVGSYPATEQQWKDGQRSYYCFANRSSGQPLTSSVAGPGPA